MVQTPAIYGDIQPADDYPHPMGPEPNFNESMYFNFFDNARRLGGFLRIGNRPNEGYAEVTVCLYQPDGSVLFNYKRPEIKSNEGFAAGGMRFQAVEPFVRLRTTYEGSVVFLRDASQMGDPAKAFGENPHQRVALDLVHEAIGPAYGSAGAGGEDDDPEKGFARAHYEQHMRISGVLEIEGERITLDALGLRDHSWGPRYWQAIQSYRWLTCAFGTDLALMVSEVRRPDRPPQEAGVVVRDGRLVRITSVRLDSRFRPGTREHTGLTARLALESGESIELEGEVRGYIPLRNRRQGMTTHIGEGMTEYRCLGRSALGISEYLDQVE